MNDFVTSVIRTWTPIIVGAVGSWVAATGINLSPEASAGLIVFLTALFQGVYYVVARVVERRFPQAGFLLGSPKKPLYAEDK